jgi:DNA-directed RNA polymerase subunit RPC12/RpoP
MRCIHEIEGNNTTLCDLGSCESCIGMFPERQKTDCQFCETKEDIEARESLTEEDLKEIVGLNCDECGKALLDPDNQADREKYDMIICEDCGTKIICFNCLELKAA